MPEIGKLIEQAEALLPTNWGEFILTAYADDKGDYTPHLVLRHPNLDSDSPVYVRIHSECITGDIFHSLKCDCGQQLNDSMAMIAEHRGLLIYLRQEGRGIGIINKLKAYKHQEKGLNTIEANEALGLQADYREYKVAGEILNSLGITQIKLITNNPDKIQDLKDYGINVVDRIPILTAPNRENIDYLRTKRTSMGHFLKPDL